MSRSWLSIAGGSALAHGWRAVRDARVRTVVFAYLFAVYAYIQPVGYRHTLPDARRPAARSPSSFAGNDGPAAVLRRARTTC